MVLHVWHLLLLAVCFQPGDAFRPSTAQRASRTNLSMNEARRSPRPINFERARLFARRLGLKSTAEWGQWVSDGKPFITSSFNHWMPDRPDLCYSEWYACCPAPPRDVRELNCCPASGPDGMIGWG